MYKPYPIYNMKTGKVTALEPWLLPQDAFETLINWHLRKGVLEKSKGYSEFGEIVHTDTGDDSDSNPGNAVVGIHNYYSDGTEITLAMDTERVNKYNTTTKALEDLTTLKIRFKHADVQVHALIVGDTLTGATSGATATVDAITISSGAWVDNDACGTIHISGQTGTFEEENITDGSNIVGKVYGDSSDEEFTGDSSNLFQTCNWNNVIYMTNDNDVVQQYDGSQLTSFYVDLDVEGGPDNDITQAGLIFVEHGHLIFFKLVERGTNYFQRARWCEVRDPKTWKDANRIDAPTEECIVSGGRIGNDIYILFERSIWRFAYTGDPDLPFEWIRVDSAKGSYSRLATIEHNDTLLTLGSTRILSFDRRKATELDVKIPTELLSWNPDAVNYSSMYKNEELEQILISYVSSSGTTPDNILVYSYDDMSFSVRSVAAHCFGSTTLASNIILDDIDEILDNIDYSFDDSSLAAGYPLTLFGATNGKIYRYNHTTADDDEAIECHVISGRWNPFIEEGKQARFGYIKFLVTKDENASFDVVFYKNNDTDSYKTKEVSCDGDGDKVWVNVSVNGEVGNFHRIELTNNEAGNSPRIHAIVPYFEMGGDLSYD
jgi:hypothetical protein